MFISVYRGVVLSYSDPPHPVFLLHLHYDHWNFLLKLPPRAPSSSIGLTSDLLAGDESNIALTQPSSLNIINDGSLSLRLYSPVFDTTVMSL